MVAVAQSVRRIQLLVTAKASIPRSALERLWSSAAVCCCCSLCSSAALRRRYGEQLASATVEAEIGCSSSAILAAHFGSNSAGLSHRGRCSEATPVDPPSFLCTRDKWRRTRSSLVERKVHCRHTASCWMASMRISMPFPKMLGHRFTRRL